MPSVTNWTVEPGRGQPSGLIGLVADASMTNGTVATKASVIAAVDKNLVAV